MKLVLQNGYPSPWPEGIEDEEGEGYAAAAAAACTKRQWRMQSVCARSVRTEPWP